MLIWPCGRLGRLDIALGSDCAPALLPPRSSRCWAKGEALWSLNFPPALADDDLAAAPEPRLGGPTVGLGDEGIGLLDAPPKLAVALDVVPERGDILVLGEEAPLPTTGRVPPAVAVDDVPNVGEARPDGEGERRAPGWGWSLTRVR